MDYQLQFSNMNVQAKYVYIPKQHTNFKEDYQSKYPQDSVVIHKFSCEEDICLDSC